MTKRKHIRIVYPMKRLTFSEKLERQAKKIVKERAEAGSRSGVVSGIEHKLALTLDQIDGVRHLHDELRRSLLRQECYADMELSWMETRTPRYSPYRFPEREKLQRRLIKIEDERRQLSLIEDTELRSLTSELLKLLDRQRMVAS